MSEESSSLSFLNLEWCESKGDTSMVYPFILEPSFTDYYLEISSKLEDLIRKAKNINFTYKIIDEFLVKVVNIKTREPCLEIGVCDYEKLEFVNTHKLKLYFVLDKLKFKRRILTRNNKIYKQNIETKTNLPIENEYENLRKTLFKMQISHNCNFIFVENEEDLFRELKNILKFTVKGSKYIPKVKTFKVEKETEYLEFILGKIPGISKCVAKNVSERYRSLFNLNMAIQNGRTEELSEMVIEDAENNKSRKLGLVQMNKIVQIFMSMNPTEKLN